MAKYVYIYTGGERPDRPADVETLAHAWRSFVAGLGDSLIDGGNQFGKGQTVEGNTTSGANGYSIVDAPSLDAAIEKARPCPIFRQGGDVEVFEAMEM